MSACIAMGATGTDSGGSIRQPAAFCGIAGIKPTYGRCSRWGVVAFASSLDQPGTFARTVEDNAIMLRAMAGYDPKDSTSANIPVPDYTKALDESIKGKTIGIPKEYRVDGMPTEILGVWDQGIEWLKQAGANILVAGDGNQDAFRNIAALFGFKVEPLPLGAQRDSIISTFSPWALTDAPSTATPLFVNENLIGGTITLGLGTVSIIADGGFLYSENLETEQSFTPQNIALLKKLMSNNK